MGFQSDYDDDFSNFDSEQSKPRSGTRWLFIIVIGVFLGNALSFTAYEVYSFWKMKLILEAASTAIDKQTTNLKNSVRAQTQVSTARQIELQRQRIQRQNVMNQQNIERQRENSRKDAISDQLQKTCSFWRQQVTKENTASNRSNRDLACLRAKNAY